MYSGLSEDAVETGVGNKLSQMRNCSAYFWQRPRPPGKGLPKSCEITSVARNRGWHSSRLLDAWCERSFGVRTMWLLCFDRRRSGRQHLQQENAAQALTADSNFAS